MTRPLRVAIVGAGSAGIYAADVLMKSNAGVSLDHYERQPAPFSLIRYGVAPDPPRIKGSVHALRQVLSKPQVRLLGNVNYGVDVKLADLRRYFDSVVFTTGAERDRPVGLIGHSKGDAIETVGSILGDLPSMPKLRPLSRPSGPSPTSSGPEACGTRRGRAGSFSTPTSWRWVRRSVWSASSPVSALKVVDRLTMIDVSRAVQAAEAGEPSAAQQLDRALARADGQVST